MKKINLYIIKKFLGTFLLSISLIIVIVIVFDLSEKVEDFIENKAPLREVIFDYYLNFIPYFVNLFSALFTFISVIFFTAKMANNTEIVAILSSGISYKKLLYPYLVSALCITILSFYLANFLIPHVNIKRIAFENKYIKVKRHYDYRDIHLQVKPEGTFLYFQYFNDLNNTGYKFTMEKIKNNNLYYKLYAETISWDSLTGRWKISDYFVRTINGNEEKIRKGTLLDTTLTLKPADLNLGLVNIDMLNFPQLNRFISEQKLKGTENIDFYEVEKHKRIATPFANLVLTLIGVALSGRKIRGGIGLHLGLGIAISFAYILFMQVSTTFATFGSLPPFVAVWIPNIIFALLGLYLLKKAPK